MSQEAGRGAALLYTLNRDHVAADAVLVLASLRATFLDRLRGALEGWTLVPTHASVFGSAARGDGDLQSDIDLFIVRPDVTDEEDEEWRAQVNSLARSIEAWSGNRAGIVEISEAQVRHVKRDRPPVVRQLESDAILLFGKPVRELFRGRRQ